ncbi:uncharacterized protein F4822DRAFT_113315 [Hypoxylon trugodes]|uniref:uncharacterized protein n=1 Tax=Hypoxylon trugodes TaxID=326681 RepID=UPI0021967895|nr:uncharacterized protein F4822DRAFT_113315 [Hypoxylon trugodes]KAI1392018.1 hypothetical protein F4822DRAFT_113315 [Hypoxylon trugodes]
MVDKDSYATWKGEVDCPGRRGQATLQEARDCLCLRIPDEHIYPKVAPDWPVISIKDYVAGDFWPKEPGYYRSGEYSNPCGIADEFVAQIRVNQLIQKNPHPNLVEFKGCLEKDGRVVRLLFKRCPTDLYRLAERKPAEEDHLDDIEVNSFMEGIRSGVHHLHSMGLAHNSLDPVHILIDEEYRPVITDMTSCQPFGEERRYHGLSGWHGGYKEESCAANDEIGLKKIEEWLVNAKEGWRHKILKRGIDY